MVKAYKGFNRDMTCRGYQYKEGETYHMDTAELCKSGYHACEAPLDCLNYYNPGSSVYHEVELDELCDERFADSKICGKTIKIGARLDVAGIVQAQIDYVRAHTTEEHTDLKQSTAGSCGVASAGSCGVAEAGDDGVASAGSCGVAEAGDDGVASAGSRGVAEAGSYGVASAGSRGVASAGSFGEATAGSFGVASAGDGGVASAGDNGVASAGSCGVASAGSRGVASAGSYGIAASKGSSAVGAYGIACARGNGCRVKGGLGALLIIAEEYANIYDILHWRAVVVDGDAIKADTWYKLVDGELVEDKED